MRILVLGNSHATCLAQAYRRGRDGIGEIGELFFWVSPGGGGPSMGARDGRIVILKEHPVYRPYQWPDGVDGMPLATFDAILISALGHLDCGALEGSGHLGLGALAEFGPRTAAAELELVSDRCYRAMLRASFAGQLGYRFVRELRDAYAGPIIVQPFPYPSETLKEDDGWGLRALYDDHCGAHDFLVAERDLFLRETCAAIGLDLLPHPVRRPGGSFTPARLMRPTDAMHGNGAYGALVLRQLDAALSLRSAARTAPA